MVKVKGLREKMRALHDQMRQLMGFRELGEGRGPGGGKEGMASGGEGRGMGRQRGMGA